MPRRCCVPGCTSNYDSSLKENNKCVTTFSFPKDDERKLQWIRARKDWTPSSSAVVCVKHFCESDVIYHDKWLLSDGTVQQLSLRNPKLKPEAVPCIFPNLPSYLSSKPKCTRRDPQERHDNIIKKHSQLVEDFLKKDIISDFNDLKNNYCQQVNTFEWNVKLLDAAIHFYVLNYDDGLSIENSISIKQDLMVHVYVRGNLLSEHDLNWILPCDLKLSRWSQRVNLLAHFKSYASNSSNSELSYNLKKGLEYLIKAGERAKESDAFEFIKTLQIIIDQLQQMQNNIKGEDLVHVIKDTITFVQSCGFEILCIVTDNHSINRVAFKNLSSTYSFPNPSSPEKSIFLIFDFVHIFKNIWKNWMNLKNLHQTFVYCDFIESTPENTVKYAKFQHLKDVYQAEKNLIVKQAYKLNYESLYPTVLEKQKVNLADNIFHASTIACLNCNNNYKETAEFLQIIRNWWDIVNNRDVIKGEIKRNDMCKPFKSSSDDRIEWLKKFADWLQRWHNLTQYNGHLTKETFSAMYQSTLALISIIQYVFSHFSEVKYVLPGKFTTENLEKRFGMYRSLAGCNYNVSLDDIYSAEKKIRIKNIFKRADGSNSSLSDIQEQFHSVELPDAQSDILSIDLANEENGTLNKLMGVLNNHDYLQTAVIDESAKIYVCGYAAHSISKRIRCTECISSLLLISKGTYINKQYFDYLQRQGLSIPSDELCYMFVHMYLSLDPAFEDKPFLTYLEQLHDFKLEVRLKALEVVNKVVVKLSYLIEKDKGEGVDYSSIQYVAVCLSSQSTLKVLLSNFLHHSIYVEKLEDISRLLLHFERNRTENVQLIWSAHVNKDEVIVKGIYALLNKLALDLSSCQVEWLSEKLMNSWTSDDLQYQTRILELFLNIAKNDLYEETVHKMLTLLWHLAHRKDLTSEKLNDIFEAFTKIMQFHYDDNEESPKQKWLDKCVEEFKTNTCWEVPAMVLMRKLCQTYKSFMSNMKEKERYFCRENVIDRLQNEHAIVFTAIRKLVTYIKTTRRRILEDSSYIDNKLIDNYYIHKQQIEERLGFLSFMLKDGKQALCLEEAIEVWESLTEYSLTPVDNQLCLEWFEKLAYDELQKEAVSEIFTKKILQIPVTAINESGYKCFETFFIIENSEKKKLEVKEGDLCILEPTLIGLDVVWDIILSAKNKIAIKAIKLLKKISVNININLLASRLKHHEMYIKKCYNLLKDNHEAYCTLEIPDNKKLDTVCRVLKVLFNYIEGYENNFMKERKILPVSRACRGRDMILIIQFTQTDQNLKNFDFRTHENDILLSVRRIISEKINRDCKMELVCGDRILSHEENCTQLVEIPLSNKTVIKVNILYSNTKMREKSPSIDSELVLPGVLLSLNSTYHSILCQLHELGRQKYPVLQESSKQVLQIISCNANTVKTIHAIFNDEDAHEDCFNNMFFDGTPTEILYSLQVLYALLMPANDYLAEEVQAFRVIFMTNKKTHRFFDMFSKEYLPSCDKDTKCSIYLELAKLCKLILIIICATLAKSSGNVMSTKSKKVSSHEGFVEQALKAMYGTDHDVVLLKVAEQVSVRLAKLLEEDKSIAETVTLFRRAVTWRLPSYSVVLQITRLVWASCSGNFESFYEPEKTIHSICLSSTYPAADSDEILLHKKSVELLSISVVSNPNSLELLCNGKILPLFFNDLLLLNPNQMLRMAIAEQFLLVFICADPCRKIVERTRDSLFTLIKDPIVDKYSSSSYEVFYLLCQLIHSDHPLRDAATLLDQEIKWLQNVSYPHPVLLEGHLRLTTELVDCVDLKKKEKTGSIDGGNLIKIILDKFLFPASKIVRRCKTKKATTLSVIPICDNDSLYLSDWECVPTTDSQVQQGFVGLRNPGATCYMNSILQQLFMERNISEGLIFFEIPPYKDIKLKPDGKESVSLQDIFKDRYNILILKTIQEIFIQLKYSRMQYYEPIFLWRHFLIEGQHIRIADHQDAVNFYMLLIDSLNEALLKLNGPPLFQDTLGGTFSDQMISKDCPHQYMKEEKFNILSVNIKNHKDLTQSLKQYVKAEFLKDDNAYYCEECKKKVVATKRLCFKRLPKTLVIQLKRFEYSYQTGYTVKFHDYFEFPRKLDMLPYTVEGLSSQTKNIITCGIDNENPCPTYTLSGVVIHNGEASGIINLLFSFLAGHYFSYIRSGEVWYKFDDKYVERVDLHIDKQLEELCFGNQPNIHYTEKKLYSAYVLFYTRDDYKCPETIQPRKDILSPTKEDAITETISFLHKSSQFELEYIQFIRKLLQDNMPLTPDADDIKGQETSMISIQLGSKYLFQTGWHIANNLRGPAILWSDTLCFYLKSSRHIRSWFAIHILFRTPKTIFEYLLRCPIEDVKQAFRKMLVVVTGLLHSDGPCLPPPGYSISNHYSTMGDHIICFLLKLLITEIPQYPDFIAPYCQFFLSYAEKGKNYYYYCYYVMTYCVIIFLGSHEIRHLLTLNIPTGFIMLATNEGPNPYIKYKFQELTVLHRVIFKLVRSSECTCVRKTRNNIEMRPNMYYHGGGPVLRLNGRTRELLFGRLNTWQRAIDWLEKQTKTDPKIGPEIELEPSDSMEKVVDTARNLKNMLTDNKGEEMLSLDYYQSF
ncbi:hypothetical protein ILUMI_22366 [Ignelater luminosus]|uniref:Ubiquitinyl hydrolase 1 n=1 Tax=Ignelater luminosus TaxID=2038154 RepID=A0A8K0CH74_IGNLU|nr:hypothetical protein ILUMI_22366 [Ignelater luminosus]